MTFESTNNSNHEIDELFAQFDPLLRAIAAVAKGETTHRDQIEAALPELQANGWQLMTAVYRLWDGERDTAKLMAGLDLQDSLLVKRIVDLLDEPTQQEALEALPFALRQAILAGDADQANVILAEMPPVEAQDALRLLTDSGLVAQTSEPILAEEHEELPQAVVDALEREDVAALESALQELPPQVAQAVLDRLAEAGVVSLRTQTEKLSVEDALERFEPLLHVIANVALGMAEPTADLESVFPELEAAGWEITVPAIRIWEGERDRAALTVGLDGNSARLIHRILDLIEE
jgi:hypothetical protein